LPRSSAGASDTLDAWSALPIGGPERIIVTSFTTEAEQGLRTARRGAAGAPGSEVFESVCRLMANGARTILLTRWRTSGRTNYDLVREFVQEFPHASAAEGWQRAVVLAREAPLDLNREPRLKRSAGDIGLPTADHPFFWAGYLLVDTGTRPQKESEPAAAPGNGGDVMKDAAGTTIRVPLPALPPPQSTSAPPAAENGADAANAEKTSPAPENQMDDKKRADEKAGLIEPSDDAGSSDGSPKESAE
jgi:hypothetical protein